MKTRLPEWAMPIAWGLGIAAPLALAVAAILPKPAPPANPPPAIPVAVSRVAPEAAGPIVSNGETPGSLVASDPASPSFGPIPRGLPDGAYFRAWIDDQATIYHVACCHRLAFSGREVVIRKGCDGYRPCEFCRPGLGMSFAQQTPTPAATSAEPATDPTPTRTDLAASEPPRRSYTPPSRSYYGGGEVHVRGYYRKNGTYVQPHTRRAPRRR